jgi:hypothetical protein
MDPAVRFWLLILSVAGTVSASITLVVSAFVPGSVFGQADTLAYVGSVLVALVSMGVLVWSLTADSNSSGAAGPRAR